MGTWERLADLPLVLDGYELEGLRRTVAAGFERHTTVVRFRGAGHEGLGEDVTYEAAEQLALQAAGATLPLGGSWTLASFSERLDALALFPRPPRQRASVHYRRWAFESAALDLALRQAATSLGARLGLSPAPVRFVVSLRLGRPPSVLPLRRWLARDPALRFKLDATPSWSEDLLGELAATRAVETVDFKGAYSGTPVDGAADPDLYERVVRLLGNTWIEDPALTPETEAVLEAHRERVAWDAPIHRLADVRRLPFRPGALNMKPSRFGTLRELCAVHDFARAEAIATYGGGQFELGPGRGQIQLLASLFHADAANDVAPAGYNDAVPADDLPRSPLAPRATGIGFR